MKKILILISAFVVGCTPTRKTSTGAAQLPELGWTPKQVAKFMMEKYDYSVIDTEYGVEGGEVVYNFAPVSFYGIDGLLSICFFDSDSTVDWVDWHRGPVSDHPKKPWLDRRTQNLIRSKLTRNEISLLADSISTIIGKPKIRTEKDDEKEMGIHSSYSYIFYSWKIGKRDYYLHENSDGLVSYECSRAVDNKVNQYDK